MFWHNRPVNKRTPLLKRILTAGIAAAISITPDACIHSQSSAFPVVAQVQVVTPDAATNGQAASLAGVTYGYGLLGIGSCSHSQAATSPSLGNINVVSPDASVHDEVSSSPIVVSGVNPVIGSCVHGHTATQPTVVVKSVVPPLSCSHSQGVSSASFTGMVIFVTPDTASNSQLSDGDVGKIVRSVATKVRRSTPYLPQVSAFKYPNTNILVWAPSGGPNAPDQLSHDQVATSPILSTRNIIQPDNCLNGQVSSRLNFGNVGFIWPILRPADEGFPYWGGFPIAGAGLPGPSIWFGRVEQIVSNPSVVQMHSIQPSNCSNVTTTSVAGVASRHVFVANNATHAQAANPSVFETKHIFVPSLCGHVQLVVEPVNSPYYEGGTPDICFHTQVATSPAIAVQGEVDPDSVIHAQATGSPLIAETIVTITISVQSADHLQLSTAPVGFTPPIAVSPDLAGHGQRVSVPLMWMGTLSGREMFISSSTTYSFSSRTTTAMFVAESITTAFRTKPKDS